MLLTSIIYICIILYAVIALGHFAYLYNVAASLGYHRDGSRLTFLGLCSIFWPITWIWFIIDRLRRGRVA